MTLISCDVDLTWFNFHSTFNIQYLDHMLTLCGYSIAPDDFMMTIFHMIFHNHDGTSNPCILSQDYGYWMILVFMEYIHTYYPEVRFSWGISFFMNSIIHCKSADSTAKIMFIRFPQQSGSYNIDRLSMDTKWAIFMETTWAINMEPKWGINRISIYLWDNFPFMG